MSANTYNNTLTPTTTGNVLIPLPSGFTPVGARIVAGATGANGSADNWFHKSDAFVDSTGYTTLHADFGDTSGSLSNHWSGTNKVVAVYKRVSGTPTLVNEANFVSLTSSGLTVDITNNTVLTQYNVQFFGA